MKLLIVSHKEVWRDPSSPTGYATVGGFPMQIVALAELFETTTLLVFERRSPAPAHLIPLAGNDLEVETLGEPRARGVLRKIALVLRSPVISYRIWRAVGRADGVHALVPGDLGFLGLLVALARRKPLLVRHCGTWGHRATLADRYLMWLLPRIAKGERWILATGGGDNPPVPEGNSSWIFSTSLSKAELEALEPAKAWQPGSPLALITVGRLTKGKNTVAVVEALPEIRRHVDASLTIVGDGAERPTLEHRVSELGLEGAVHFRGNLSHAGVLEQLCQNHLLIFPTRVAEGFPKAVLEALACGVPVLATPVSVVPRLLEPVEGAACGWCLDGTRAEAVARGVLNVISDTTSLVAAAAAARRRAQAFTMESWQDSLRHVLEKVWPDHSSAEALGQRAAAE